MCAEQPPGGGNGDSWKRTLNDAFEELGQRTRNFWASSFTSSDKPGKSAGKMMWCGTFLLILLGGAGESYSFNDSKTYAVQHISWMRQGNDTQIDGGWKKYLRNTSGIFTKFSRPFSGFTKQS